MKQEDAAAPAYRIANKSGLPAEMTASAVTSAATPLLQDPPGQVRMIAFWGEPGAHEPDLDTPVTFLGVDGRWRALTRRALGDKIGWLSSGDRDLSPDGSRWVLGTRGWTKMLDFRTSELVNLTRDKFGAYASWSPDSRTVALWRPNKPGITVFSRSGRRIATLPINVQDRSVFMLNDHRVTIFEQASGRESPRLRFVTHDLQGDRVEVGRCALPSGYPPRATGVDGYDGVSLWIHALVDSKRYVYRYSMIDTSTGEVGPDIEYSGTVPHIDQWVDPGVYIAGISGGPDGIYAVDPSSGEMIRLSRLSLYQDQEGYENHANSQFAQKLVFERKVR